MSRERETAAQVNASGVDGGIRIVCPFLRAVDLAGQVGPPVAAPDPENHCTALGVPQAQALAQQELICLAPAHSSCPRFLRGSILASTVATNRVEPRFSRPVVAAAMILVASIAASATFALVRGISLSLPSPSPDGSAAAAVVTSASPAATSAAASSSAAAVSTPRVTPAPSKSLAPAPTASPAATPTPAPTAHPTSASTPGPTPRPTTAPATPVHSGTGTASRYAVLVACPGRPNCYIYTVRAGDNLTSIVNWFGVPMATVLRLNTWIQDPALLKEGDRLILPPPTR